ncbi:hypothetical protein TRAPUB_1402 [Trametes pubescens]|uniref:Uncharacterized protein n=1 Tax=Trametes pubescens TaxID=154538 RepID=A0A1M2VJJ6_TRAPU|nr:hypothetical protein TRAPUB_1402 [Trametes pubescens]
MSDHSSNLPLELPRVPVPPLVRNPSLPLDARPVLHVPLVRDPSPALDPPPLFDPPPVLAADRPLQRIVVDESIPTAAHRRLRRLADHGSPDTGIYSLTRVPENIRWHDDANPPLLHVQGSPLGLRVVGTLTEFGVHASAEDAHFFFVVNPLRPIDHEGMLRLLDLASPPPRMGYSFHKRNKFDLSV